jgi:MFS family permease
LYQPAGRRPDHVDRAVVEDRNSGGSRIVLVTLESGQFLMTLDSSVMNVSIAQVAKDVGTTVTGIQTAITLYTLVMAALMITGGKVGSMMAGAVRSRSDV